MIRRFGFLDTPYRGTSAPRREERHSCTVVALLILTVALAFVCSANWQVLAQRNNNDNKGKPQQAPQRPPQEQQDVQALVTLVDTALMADTGIPIPAPGAQPPTAPITPKPLAFGAADKSEGEIAVKWQSNHFVKGQSGDTYVPFTIAVDKAQLSKGAALYVRIVSAEQAAGVRDAAMAAMAVPPPAQRTASPRRCLHGRRSSGTAFTSLMLRTANSRAPCSSSPASTWRS